VIFFFSLLFSGGVLLRAQTSLPPSYALLSGCGGGGALLPSRFVCGCARVMKRAYHQNSFAPINTRERMLKEQLSCEDQRVDDFVAAELGWGSPPPGSSSSLPGWLFRISALDLIGAWRYMKAHPRDTIKKAMPDMCLMGKKSQCRKKRKDNKSAKKHSNGCIVKILKRSTLPVGVAWRSQIK
jgi:hypothetical protein